MQKECNNIAALRHLIIEPLRLVVCVSLIDIETVKAAKAGDKESFARVYDTVAPELYKVALYTLGNAQDAEDAVSETFVEAYKGISNLRDEASFKRWIMTILSIRCKRRITGYIKERKNVDIDEMTETPAQPENVSQTEKITVWDAVNSLEQQEKQIVMLATVQGYTTREVAQMLGLPHGTVSSKLHRTLKKLKKALQ